MKKQNLSARALALHKKLRGKISTGLTMPIKNRADLSLVYTPGVAAVSLHMAKRPNDASDYTIKGRTVAVISDGTAVLGLGNIGPYGALPVMEGKCALFKTFANVDAFPLVLDIPRGSLSAEEYIHEVVETVVRVAPPFGGINLEDFAAPACFEIEERIKARLNIPVMHDDQHGTAIAATAALINAAKVVKKDVKKLKTVIVGAGAAGTAIAKLLLKAGLTHVVVLDSKGVVHHDRTDLHAHKKDLAHATSRRHNISGGLDEALAGADAVIGVSGPAILSRRHIKLMAARPIVFALANPVPEIMPEEARAAGAAVIATGRSDYPNQINNSLVFPGVFRGALDHRVKKITDDMKLRAAKNLAALVRKPTAGKIVPTPFEKGVAAAVAKAIR